MDIPTVQCLMRRDPVTITSGDTLAAAQALMQQKDIRQLPIVDHGVLTGMLSDRDLHAHTGYLERTKVDAAMSEHPVVVAPSDTPAQAARLMLEHKINAVPVVEDGRLVGILSRSDLLRLLVNLIEGERPQH